MQEIFARIVNVNESDWRTIRKLLDNLYAGLAKFFFASPIYICEYRPIRLHHYNMFPPKKMSYFPGGSKKNLNMSHSPF